MLLKLSSEQFVILQSKLERSGISIGQRHWATHAENRVFYSLLDSMGLPESRMSGKRAPEPNYGELGITRTAGAPTAEDVAKYRKVTNGGELTEDGLVVQGLLFDNDLIPDRYSVATLNLLNDLHSKYLGRANDFNHEFDATQARSRIIEVGLGTDPGTALHPDTPVEALRKFSPANPFSGTYTALTADLAFPRVEGSNTIDRVKAGLIKDISIAFQNAHKTTYCSLCLLPMDSFWFWSYCEEHGFPGGRLGSDAVVAIMNSCSDVFTFGLVSDGAVKRAGLILDPGIETNEVTDSSEKNSTNFRTLYIGGTLGREFTGTTPDGTEFKFQVTSNLSDLNETA